MTAGRRDYIAAADVLRAAAVGLVGWYHIWQQSWLDPGFPIGNIYVNLQQLVRNGYLMVDVLLVLSGFLLALPYAHARLDKAGAPSTREFYVKRFWRIMPSYALAILLTLLLWALPQRLYPSPGAAARDLLTHFTFTHNLSVDTYFLTPLPGVLWTMGVEAQFYLLFPLIARLYGKHPVPTCCLLAGLGLLARYFVYQLDDTLMWVNQLPCMLDLFAVGMAAALVYTRLSAKKLLPAVQRLLLLGALASLGALFQLMYRQTLSDGEVVRHSQLVLRLPLGLAAGTFLVCGGLAPAGVQRAMGNPVTRFLSAVSYNFYIWHQFTALRLKDWHIPPYLSELPNQAGEQPWQTRYTLLCFAAAIALAAAVTYLWEKPLYRRGMRRLRRETLK